MLSKRVQNLSASLTIEISTKARELKMQGRDILSFSAGEPDFDTPQIIKNEAIKAINSGKNKYTAVAGINEVRKAIQYKLKKDNNLDYELENIITNVGAKQSLFNLAQAIIDNGDEVIIPTPYWVTYPEIVTYSGGVSVFLQTDESEDFKITPEKLKNAITPKTKALILNSPSNPTGSVYSKEELLALGEVLKDTKIIVISDEMYENLLYGDTKFCATASVSEDMFNRTITINGLSKCGAMTGWRFGYMASPFKELTKALIRLQSQSTSNICSIVQYAAIPALLGEANDDIEKMRVEFEKRKEYACKAFSEIEKLSVYEPKGAFYLFINISKIQKDSMQFCKDLLEQKGVACVPGIAFGMDGYIRFSFATDLKSIKEGIKRIKEFVQ